MSTREQGTRLLHDIADLLKVRDENTALQARISELETSLNVAISEADHYRAELAAAGIRCDHLTEQNMEYRIQLEAMAQDAENELETLKTRRSKMAIKARQCLADAEMKPYRDLENERPLARIEVN